ncbi:hypothetical protein T484DRAFT_1892771 [Baffinella frigidus]|nr:hypothetical protein T484DRAFT_1892771 [Cryptophyta sp. CCMP2293]
MASTMTHGEALAELGLGLTFSLDDMKAAYRKTAMTWHPDKNPDRLEEATAKFQRVNTAHDILKLSAANREANIQRRQEEEKKKADAAEAAKVAAKAQGTNMGAERERAAARDEKQREFERKQQKGREDQGAREREAAKLQARMQAQSQEAKKRFAETAERIRERDAARVAELKEGAVQRALTRHIRIFFSLASVNPAAVTLRQIKATCHATSHAS